MNRQRIGQLGQRLLFFCLGSTLFGATVVLLRWIFLRLRRVTLTPTAFTTGEIGPSGVTPGMRRIVVSDIHLGGGDRLDDFEPADREAFISFMRHYVINGKPTELILAGDTVELLQIRLPSLPDDEWSESAAVQRLEAVVTAHAEVFTTFCEFLAEPASLITVLIGNHDFELHYPAAKAAFRRACGLAEGDERVRFAIRYTGDGIYLEHGNQYDGWNRFVHFAGITEPFEVVRGTQLVKEVINELEEDPLALAPLIDNVKPSSAFFWYMVALPRLRVAANRRFVVRGVLGFLQVNALPTPHHLPMSEDLPRSWAHFWPIAALLALITWLRRARVARHQAVARQVGELVSGLAPPDEVIDELGVRARRELRRQVRRFNDRYTREMILIAKRPEHQATRLFICGHTHQARIVPISEHQTYINTGTWTEVVYDVGTMVRQEQRYPFLEITGSPGQPEGRLLVWHGAHQAPSVWHNTFVVRVGADRSGPARQLIAGKVVSKLQNGDET